jgi:DNA-binding transcriptional LysR family regulator
VTIDAPDRRLSEFVISPTNDTTVPPITRIDVELLQGVAATGTLRGAAKAARIKQSAVGRQLERLERRFGHTLTAGGPDNLRLAEVGTAVLTGGLRFLSRFTEAVQRITGEPNSTLPRTLRLAAVGDPWDEFVDDIAINLPSLVPAVVSAGPEECRVLFDTYHVDAVYSWQPFDESTRLSRPFATYPVVDEPLWVGLPADHPGATQDSLSLLDLRDDDWIVGPDPDLRTTLGQAGRRAGFEPRVRHVAEFTSVIRSLLWQGSGVALVTPMSVPPGDGAGFVIRPLVDGPRRPYVLNTDPTVLPDRLARALSMRLRASYQTRARRMNPAYAASLDDRKPPTAAPLDLSELVSGLNTSPQPASEQADDHIQPEDVIMLRVISESGSLNRAAPTLLISQPALTRRLKVLERRLGTKLLVRGYRGTVLTARAQELVDAVTDAEADFHRTMRRLLDHPPQGQRAQSSEPSALGLVPKGKRSAGHGHHICLGACKVGLSLHFCA